MEDDFKILKVDYLSNHYSDFSEIWNLGSGDQTKINNRGHTIEVDLKILKVEYLSNQ